MIQKMEGNKKALTDDEIDIIVIWILMEIALKLMQRRNRKMTTTKRKNPVMPPK